MKKIRKISQNPIVILLVLFNFIFVSCNRDTFGNESKTSELVKKRELVKKIDGEQLFRQIFFLQGGNSSNVLKNLPYYSVNIENLQSLSEKQQIEQNKFVDEIISIINKNDSEYFNKFQKIVESDDPYEIDNSLKNCSETIINSITETQYGNLYQKSLTLMETKYKDIDIKNEKNYDELKNDILKELQQENGNSSNSQELMSVVAAALAIYVAAVALETLAVANMVAAVSVFVYTRGKFWSASKFGETQSSLMNEEIVLALIENY
jgi:SdpC family antimicrobial peptide